MFDSWNEHKKCINKSKCGVFYREKEIWWCNLGKNIGSEQDGKGENYERPVLIIKAFSCNVCLIIPLTTTLKYNPYYLKINNVDGREASVIITQMRLIDVRRLINRICIVDSLVFSKIRNAIRDLF